MIDFNKKIENSSKIPLSESSLIPKGICGIYKIENKTNGKVYIGKSVDIRGRLLRHVRDSKKVESKLYLAFMKYGIESFECEILIKLSLKHKTNDFIDKELDILEMAYVYIYDSFKTGYNSTEGSDGARLGFKHTIETRNLLSKIKRNCYFKVAGKSKNVFGYDALNEKYFTAETVASMARLINANHGSVWNICSSKRKGVSLYNRYIFAYSSDELDQKIKKWLTLQKK